MLRNSGCTKLPKFSIWMPFAILILQTDEIQCKIPYFRPCCHGNGVAMIIMLHLLYPQARQFTNLPGYVELL